MQALLHFGNASKIFIEEKRPENLTNEAYREVLPSVRVS